MKMRAVWASAIVLVLTVAVISNAYYQKKQFYPSVVYITKSNSSMAVIYIQSVVLVLMLGKLMRKIFLGTLRAAEFEHLMERFWYALTETCLAFTVFRDDFNAKFVAMFTVLLFLKSFHWLAEDRVDYMERSPIIGWLFYIRVSALLLVLGTLDYLMISHAYYSTILRGPTVQLVFGFEYAVLITMVANTTIKYILHSAEMRAETPWENKAVFLLYTELVIGFIRVVLYLLFVIIMVRIYTLPLFAFRPMYYTMRNFKKAFSDVILSRRAIRNMNTLYPDATPEELSQSDNICIICREDMVSNAKKLPCGHIFHTACLRSWFQRQQTCPTCRLNILRAAPTVQPNRPPPAEPAQNNEPNVQNGANLNNVPPAPAAANPFPNLMTPNFTVNPATTTATNNTNNAFIPPPFPLLSPYMLPPPPPVPPQLDTLTDDELRALEGNERKHVEERIKLLKNIQLLMDASTALMNQYTIITSRLPPPPQPPPNISPETTTNNETANVSAPDSAVPGPSTSKSASALSLCGSCRAVFDATEPIIVTNNDENFVKIEDLGSEEHADSVKLELPAPTEESSMNAELRRRRLQKFLKTERQQND